MLQRSILAFVLVVSVSVVEAAERLPGHPGIVSGSLGNGVSYRVMQHPNPPGHVSLRLHLPVGSFNEEDHERGFAHLLEHLAFMGSENFDTAAVIPHFERLGLTFGRHQNAMTGVDQTVYMLDLPEADHDSLTGALTFLADVLGRLTLPEDALEQERAVVLAERRARLGPGQRLMEQWLPRLLQGTLAPERLPIGTEETIRAATRADVARFYRRWYTTGNATVVIVGDIDVDEARERIELAFGALDAGPATEAVDPGEVFRDEPFAVVATDPDTTLAQVGLVHIGVRRDPPRTVDAFRSSVVENLAMGVVSRRLTDRATSGNATYRFGYAGAGNLLSVGWRNIVAAHGEAGDWEAMLDELAEEVERARRHGFSARELDDARDAMLTSARQFARTEHTLRAPLVAAAIVGAVQSDGVLMSGTQRVQLLEDLLPGITVEEVTAAFAMAFEPTRLTATVYMPDGESVPAEADVLAALEASFTREVTALEDRARLEALMDGLPEPGEVVEGVIDESNDVYSAWFANGVRMHHRYMDIRENQVGVRITLAGGGIEEDGDTRAFTITAGGVLRRFATRSLDSAAIGDLLYGRTLNVGLTVYDDAVMLSLSGPPEEMEFGFQLAHMLLTEPRLEEVAFEQWRRGAILALEASARDMNARLGDMVQSARFPDDDPRWVPLEAADIERLELGPVQEWLDGLVRRAPIEVAVVGDVSRDDALELVARYLGALPERPRIGARIFDGLRDVPVLDRRMEIRGAVPSATPRASVFVGFPGADDQAVDDVRALAQAARILSMRLTRRVREREGLVYGIGASHRNGIVVPGSGLFSSGASTDPAEADRLADIIEEMFVEFAEHGPSDDEVATALRQFETSFSETAREPGYWLGRLATHTFRGDDPIDVPATVTAYRAIDAERIRDTFRRYHDPERILRVVVVPQD